MLLKNIRYAFFLERRQKHIKTAKRAAEIYLKRRKLHPRTIEMMDFEAIAQAYERLHDWYTAIDEYMAYFGIQEIPENAPLYRYTATLKAEGIISILAPSEEDARETILLNQESLIKQMLMTETTIDSIKMQKE